ncbi:hypothetical protein PWG71_26295 [Nocardiopsis sp. N85]|uniref:hypothetical protein n=1 Tax=Nocardiopsis sp. N85 TaxID=3029400 RepID=UPI00237F1B1A|nr:hypothetical protein [Nocardiopsis sp. N85]MDE3724911.1 hypothetical protein [Nocardiopsis sp. N85]
MNEQATPLSERCGTCGASRAGWAAQEAAGGRLRWTLEWSCDCGEVCDRGRGPAPTRVRAVIVASHGTHRLVLADPRTRSGRIPKAFRDVFGMTLHEAGEAVAALREEGYEGTRTEVLLLAALLEEAGIPTEIHPAPLRGRADPPAG